jgi:hypothetical protein
MGLDEEQTEGRPRRYFGVRAIEEPDREVREHSAVDDHVLAVRLLVRDRNRLEEDRDAHAHPHGPGDRELVRVDPELVGVARQDEQPVRRRVGRDHLQPVAVAGIVPVLVGGERREGLGALRLQELADPVLEVAALVDAEVLEDADALADQRELVLPGRVPELEEVHAEDDVFQLCRGVARSDQRGRDRPRRRARDVLRAEVVLLEDREGSREADALDPAALADEIAVVPVLLCSHDAPPWREAVGRRATTSRSVPHHSGQDYAGRQATGGRS